MGKILGHPVAALVAAVGFLVVSALALVEVAGAWQAGRDLDAATTCADDRGQDCLGRARGVLEEGRSVRRVPGLRWSVLQADGERLSAVLPPRQSDELAPYVGRQVGVWARDDHLVAVELPDGRQVRAATVGLSGVALFLGVGVGAAALSLTGLARFGGVVGTPTRIGRPLLVLALAVVVLAWFATPVWLLAGTGAALLLLAWGLVHGHVLPPARPRDGRPRSHVRCWWCALVGAPDCAPRRVARSHP